MEFNEALFSRSMGGRGRILSALVGSMGREHNGNRFKNEWAVKPHTD
jgi:hypothetical protein